MNTYNLQVPNRIPDNVRKEMNAALSPRECRIVSDFHQIAVRAFLGKEISDNFWSDSIKKALTKFAEEQNLLCCYSDTTGEWLYDVSWVETASRARLTNPWKAAQRLALVCECEWSENEDDILWDFMKLSWARADLRLFIYTNHMKPGAVKHPTDLCREHCPASVGSRFLLIGFPKRVKNGEPFRIDTWTT